MLSNVVREKSIKDKNILKKLKIRLIILERIAYNRSKQNNQLVLFLSDWRCEVLAKRRGTPKDAPCR